jgi:transcriptional repressor NrdR
VIKRDGRRDEFDRDKLLRSVRVASVKRPLPSGALEKLVDDIESDLQGLGKAEIPAAVIGDTTLIRLRNLDSVAYVRYASVYRDFDTLDGFIDEIREFRTIEPEHRDADQLELIPNEFTIPSKPRGRRGRRPSITTPAPEIENTATESAVTD